MDVVRKHLGITAEGHESYSRTGGQWRLKITRAAADVARTGRKRTPTPRLRVYGSFPMLEEMNRVIAVGTGLLPKKLQLVTTGTGETWCLYYTGESFRAVVEWLYAGAGLYNPAVWERFENFALSVNRLRKPT